MALGKIDPVRGWSGVRPAAAWFAAVADARWGVVRCWERQAEHVAEWAQDAREAGIVIEQARKFGFADQAVQPVRGGGDAGARDDFGQPAMATREQDRAGECVGDQNFGGLMRRDSRIGGVGACWRIWLRGWAWRRAGSVARGKAPANAVNPVPDHHEQATKQADLIAIAGDGAQQLVHDPGEADDQRLVGFARVHKN